MQSIQAQETVLSNRTDSVDLKNHEERTEIVSGVPDSINRAQKNKLGFLRILNVNNEKTLIKNQFQSLQLNTLKVEEYQEKYSNSKRNNDTLPNPSSTNIEEEDPSNLIKDSSMCIKKEHNDIDSNDSRINQSGASGVLSAKDSLNLDSLQISDSGQGSSRNNSIKTDLFNNKEFKSLKGFAPVSQAESLIKSFKQSKIGRLLHLDGEPDKILKESDSLKIATNKSVSDTIPLTQTLSQENDKIISKDDTSKFENDTLLIVQEVDSLKGDLVGESKIGNPDSTNEVGRIRENGLNDIVSNDAANLIEKRVEALSGIPSKYHKENSEALKKEINDFEKVDTIPSLSVHKNNAEKDKESVSLLPMDNKSLTASNIASPPSMELDKKKLMSSELQGFESIKFDEKALSSMIDNLKKSGKTSYVKATKSFDPNKYMDGIENEVGSEVANLYSEIENEEKELSKVQNIENYGIGNLNHNIVSKDVLKEVDSLISVDDFAKYSEKEKKTAEGILKEIKIKEPDDFVSKSFTELDVNVEQFDSKSVNVTPKLGYHFLKQLDMGAGLNFQMPGAKTDIEKKVGYEVFSRFNMTKFMYLQAEGVALVPGISNLDGKQETFDKTMLLGLGYVQKVGKQTAVDLSIFHNPNQTIELENLKGYQWKMKMGLRFYEKTGMSKVKKQ